MNKIKSLLKGSPVAMVVAGLVIAGVATATAYNFFTAQATVMVEEAIVLSMGANDDMSPYMLPEGGVLPAITLEDTGAITITKVDGVDASEFVAGETLIIPFNLRNRSDGALPLRIVASEVSEPGLDVEFEIYKAGIGQAGWDNPVYYTMGSHEGAFGSADTEATILFAKVHALGNCPTGDKVFSVLFSRGE